TSTKLGIIATGRRLILPTRDDKGVIVVAGTHVDYFELSPIRNWRWLAGWTVLPPTVIALLLRIGRRRRGKVVAA
ncbi:MAG TPA: hypothetical protein VM452_03955, partial [Caulifigura sp.]|nr:hypothetical protein [Caulifigura sp.]